MTLQEQIKNDLKIAMKEKDEDKKNAIRIIMGEFSRLETKELSDDAVVAVLKKLVKSEKEMMERSGATSESPYLNRITSYNVCYTKLLRATGPMNFQQHGTALRARSLL